MSEKPLTPWIIAEESGKISSSHCDYMAGLGETRSHVAMTVTQKRVKEVQYALVEDIDFIGKKRSAAMLASSEFRSSPPPSPSPLTTSASFQSASSSVKLSSSYLVIISSTPSSTFPSALLSGEKINGEH